MVNLQIDENTEVYLGQRGRIETSFKTNGTDITDKFFPMVAERTETVIDGKIIIHPFTYKRRTISYDSKNN